MADKQRDVYFVFRKRPTLFTKSQNFIFEPHLEDIKGTISVFCLKALTRRNFLEQFSREK